MLIKEIELYNFRIYKGKNKINILPTNDKNIIIISGKNGFGKTTFLMSLVWCLYGKQMEKVDELYKKEITDKGGYSKYIGNSLNRLAKNEGETRFSVSITFTDVKIPDITCREVKITRSYDIIASTSDKVGVLIDGYPNELIEDLTTDKQSGEEIFIRDFILPLEIAKFFFFDAEKIVSLAKINSPEERRLLSKAYSEVLGIKKYEDLKQNLEIIQDDYRKKSAKPEEKEAFNQVETDIKNAEIEIDKLKREEDELNQEKIDKKHLSNEIQEKLIRAGNQMTIEQLNDLRSDANSLEDKIANLQNDLKELFDLIPFALSGETLSELSNQILIEKNYKEAKFRDNDVVDKTNKVLDDLEQEKKKIPYIINTEIRTFYENQIKNLIRKHFFSNIPELPSNFEFLLDFSDSEVNELNGLVNNLKLSFKEAFTRILNEYNFNRNQLEIIRRRIRDAEKNAEDEYISRLRTEKEALDLRLLAIDDEIAKINEKIGELKNEIKTFKQKQEELRKKIDDSRSYNEKDSKIQKIIAQLKEFIKRFKEDKKNSLEKGILSGLTTLLHKKGFIQKVLVDISHSGEDVDINLYGERNDKIDKGSLSMGESQMYASALLNALVDESDIEFPVFIDSPMQKFDKDHAENIIQEFYPSVSNQVIIFPLIHKELTINEFDLLKDNVNKAYLINNINSDSSQFLETEPKDLFQTYNQIYS